MSILSKLASVLSATANKIDSPELSFDTPVRLPRSPQGMMDYLIDATFNGVGDSASATTGTVLMNLARKTGHPRWAIMSAIYEAVGFDEADKRFPTHKEIIKAAATKHARIGVVRGMQNDQAQVTNLADELAQLKRPQPKAFDRQVMEDLAKTKRRTEFTPDFGLRL